MEYLRLKERNNMNAKLASILAMLIILGIYVLPSVTARFSGSHTMEYNDTYAMECGVCHQYIADELNLSSDTPSESVMNAHINAMGNWTYANASDPNAPLQINATTVTQTTVCKLCHEAEMEISGVHTQVVTRACTDRDCHGLPTSGVQLVFSDQNITQKLSSSADAHSGWYNGMEAVNSTYVKANTTEGGNYTTSFYTCLGCHTHVGMSMNISRPQVFNINITRNTSGFFVSAPAVNDSVMNVTTSFKQDHDSMWS